MAESFFLVNEMAILESLLPSMESSSALSVSGLYAGYGARVVLHDVNLEVGCGQTYGLIGLNGVGKTTLIKTVLGLKDAIKGDIRVFGRSNLQAECRRHIAFLPERFDPPWFLKGGEFVRFAASLYGRRVADEEIVSSCEDLALDPAAIKHKVQSYSKGMRQKLGLIATVLTGCDLLVLDEPMSGLDPLARSLVKDMLEKVKGQGRTILLSSHILADLDEICDKVSVIHDGLVCFTGRPMDLREQTQEHSLERAFLKVIKRAA